MRKMDMESGKISDIVPKDSKRLLLDFLTMNPFIIQSSALMPSSLSFFCIIISIFIAFSVKSKEDVIFYSGIMLFLTILLYFGYTIFITDFETTLFKSNKYFI